MPPSDKRSAPAARFVLAPDEVHLWRVALPAPEETLRTFERILSADERQRADRFRFEPHRRRFVAGRGALRTILAPYAGHPPAALEFAYGAQGKPSLAGPSGTDGIFFNASHSDGIALYAITRAGEIGVDVERVRALPEWREIAPCVFTADPDASPPGTLVEFFREWTRHEARVKATGSGLGGPAETGRTGALHSLTLAADLIAAIAVPAGVRQIAWRSWCHDFANA